MENNNTENKIIFDININSIQDIYGILLNKSYDFASFEIDEEKVSLKFRKEGKIIEEKFIKFPIYSEILVKAKTNSGLDVGVTNEEQEGTGEIEIDGKKYKSVAKVVPSKLGEKLFLKIKIIEAKKETKKEVKPIELGKIIGFFGAILIVILIIGGAFLSFIVLNAKTIEDVNFFLALGVNLNEINNFIGKLVGWFFSLLTSILTIFTAIFLLKSILTKSIFKKKKTTAAILGILFLILTIASASAWLGLDRKVKNLPKWDIMALGDVQLFDNKIYKSKIAENINKKEKNLKTIDENEKKSYSNINQEQAKNLIGPIEILFDVSQLAKKESSGGNEIESYIWTIGNEEIETKDSKLIKNFDKKGNYDVKIKFLFKDGSTRDFDNKKAQVPSIGILGIVSTKEKVLNSGAKLVTFDASSLKEFGNFEWYNLSNESNNIASEKSIFITGAIFDEAAFLLNIKNGDSIVNQKVFIVDGEQESQISGDIDFEKSLANDKEYTFKVTNPKANEGIGFIEKYIWIIDGKEYSRNGDIDDAEKSSEVKHTFANYGKYNISVELIPTSGESKKISKTIDIGKDLKIKEGLKFLVNGENYTQVFHNKSTGDYRLNEFGVPTVLEMDSRYVKSDNENYSLYNISWDYNSDGNIDSSSRIGKINLDSEGIKNITVNYKFRNIILTDDIIEVKERVNIEAIKKEYEVNFKINQNTEYAPTTIGFDASQSYIKDGNVAKFIWDFGDGITEEGDAVVRGHRYLTDGEYDIKLTIIGSDGKRFTTTKKLILKPKAQKVKIKASMKEAPIYQGIDFDSSESIGDIAEYRWDFGDGETSFEANPTHSYDKPGTYKVNLKVEFRNRNIMEDTINITITN